MAKGTMSAKLKAIVEPKAAPVRPARERVRPEAFSLLPNEYQLIVEMRNRVNANRRNVSKSEVVRAAVTLLAELDDAALLEALDRVPRVQTGRPPRDEA
jgi:hypothetical protein